jgi:hypothetical protein
MRERCRILWAVESFLLSIFVGQVEEQAGFGFRAWQSAKLELQRIDLAHAEIRRRHVAPDQWEIAKQAGEDFWMYV